MLTLLVDLGFLLGFVAAVSLLVQPLLRVVPGPAPVRILGVSVAVLWLAVLTFHLLASAGWYSRPAGLTALLVLGVALRIGLGRLPSGAVTVDGITNGTDGADVADGTGLRRWEKFLGLPTAVVLALDTAVGLVAPPMAWDALTYHLPKAAMWIQSGSHQLPDFPGAWSYYRWFRSGGDVLFSWAMVVTRSDQFLALLGLATVLALFIAARECARELGSDAGSATLVAVAVISVPAILRFTVANYVDNLAALGILSGILFALRFARTHDGADALLASAATSLAMGVKVSMLAPGAAIVGFLLLHLLRHRSRGPLALVVTVLALGSFEHLAVWARTGSPVYPFRLPVPGLHLPFHEQLVELTSGAVRFATVATPAEILVGLFSDASGPNLNLGLGVLWLLAFVPFGLIEAGRRRGATVPLLLVSCLGLALAGSLGPDNRGIWTLWADVSGRLLVPALVPLLLVTPLVDPRSVRRVLCLALILGWTDLRASAWPPGLLPTALLLGSGLCLTAWVTWRATSRRGALAPAVPAVVAALLVVVRLAEPLRPGWDAEIARGMEEQTAFVAHTVIAEFAQAAPIWRCFEEGSHRLVVVTGNEGSGQHQFFYPLLGTDLDNRLLPPPDLERLDRAGWLRALEDLDADAVVGLWPPTAHRALLDEARGWRLETFGPSGAPWVARRRGSAFCGEGSRATLPAVPALPTEPTPQLDPGSPTAPPQGVR